MPTPEGYTLPGELGNALTFAGTEYTFPPGPTAVSCAVTFVDSNNELQHIVTSQIGCVKGNVDIASYDIFISQADIDGYVEQAHQPPLDIVAIRFNLEDWFCASTMIDQICDEVHNLPGQPEQMPQCRVTYYPFVQHNNARDARSGENITCNGMAIEKRQLDAIDAEGNITGGIYAIDCPALRSPDYGWGFYPWTRDSQYLWHFHSPNPHGGGLMSTLGLGDELDWSIDLYELDPGHVPPQPGDETPGNINAGLVRRGVIAPRRP